MKLQYGFLADPDKELWENLEEYYKSMPITTFLIGTPTEMTCHDVCETQKAPVGIEHLLGLGHKYCIRNTQLQSRTINKMMKRLRTNIRWKDIYREEEDENNETNYIPGLHINTELEPDLARPEIEDALNTFEVKMKAERAKYAPRYIHPNLTPLQSALVKKLGKNEVFKVMTADKNCGSAIAETECVTEQSVNEHLSNSDVYKRLSKGEATAQLKGVEMLIMAFYSAWQEELSKAEHTYLKRGLKRDRGKFSRFYTTIKMHKVPHKFRPIVAQCGTAIASVSSWLHYKLKKLLPFVPTYIKNTRDFHGRLQDLNELGRLPENARMIKADAISMYTDIDTNHALATLRMFLEELQEQGLLPENFNIDMILEAAKLVMRWNLFEYGDCYFKQLTGTAMGTPAAVMWAIIYYCWHEKHVIIPKYKSKMPLMCRFIDDIFAIVLIGGQDGMNKTELDSFKKDINDFGILKWNVDEPSISVDYLDLTVKIENGMIVTKTYQKPINLYQYITPNSAHPPWMIKGIVTSTLQTYHYQNTHAEDYWDIAMLYYRRLRMRGWDRKTLEPIFVKAHKKIESQQEEAEPAEEVEILNKEHVILHLEYHPNDIPRKRIRDLWDKHCGELLSQSVANGGLGINKMTIAYSRPRNLRDLTQRAKLCQHPGKEVSTFF